MKTHSFGPPELGRGIILDQQQDIPEQFANSPVFAVTEATVANPTEVTGHLHRHWANREPVVIRLGVEPAALKQAAEESSDRSPWELGARFLFHRHRLHFLLWNNNWDARSGTPVWWWTKKATALGATAGSDRSAATGDITLAGGTTAFCDGGPVGLREVSGIPVVSYISIEGGSLTPLRAAGNSGAELATDQRAAVEHHQGPARIIAPAGSGKTRVLTERLRHVLSDWNVSPQNVCAVAYNTRAASELTERTEGLAAHIRTLNSLALAIVNGTGGFARSHLEPRQRQMVDERGVRNLLQELVDLPRRANTDPMALWLEALSAVRLGLRSPSLVEEEFGEVTGLGDVFDRYRARLADNGLLDFDEQIYRAVEILLRDPRARKVAQLRCRMLLVDEFQDLTPAHLLMLRLLASPALNVFGVGDDDQVIYGYAGADPAYLVDFDDLFPGARYHALEINYRCPPAVVSAAANVLTRNAVRVKKNISPRPERQAVEGELRVELLPADQMATRALDLLREWSTERPAEQLAVLARVNVTLLPVQVVLSQAGIAHTAPVNASLLERTGIRTALAYLRIGLEPTSISRADIVDTVRRPSRKIARNVVEMMTKNSTTSLAGLRRLGTAMSGNDGPRVAAYVEDLQAVADAIRAGDTASALETVRHRVGLGETMDVLDGSRKEVDRSTHGDDLAAVTAVAHLHPDTATFEPWLRKVLAVDAQNNGVRLSTVHKVKGREWDRVIVYDASAGLMPHRLSTERPEERRVFHVALTRGRQQVSVLADERAPSPFLHEMAEPGKPEVIAPRVLPARGSTSTAPSVAKVPAAIGLELSVPGGLEGTIVDITDSHAVISAGRARVTLQFGSAVNVRGRSLELAAPRDESTERSLAALKEWRKATANQLSVPSFTVMHDAHLEGIAEAMPSSLAELSRCKGIGATKLDRWGDEILAVIESSSVAAS